MKPKKKLLLEAVEENCRLTYQYVRGKNFCYIGHLLHKAGVKPSEMKLVNEDPITKNYGEHAPVLQRFQKILAKVYGITVDEAKALQMANDGSDTIDARRAALKYEINKL